MKWWALVALGGAFLSTLGSLVCIPANREAGWKFVAFWGSASCLITTFICTQPHTLCWPGTRLWLLTLLTGVLYGIGWILWDIAIVGGNAAISGVMYEVGTLSYVILAWFIFGEPMNSKDWFGFCLVALGALLMVK